MDTDAEWEKWGNINPYFGVITSDKFRADQLTQAGKNEFFESGRHHVNHVLTLSRRHLDANFSPTSVLDFGCGTGRLLIPFAEVAQEITGLDVASSMLKEAAKNCEEQGIKNVTLLKSDDQLSSLQGKFDLIHSVVVFQHIPVARGKRLLERLLAHLAPSGICALHFTYSKDRFCANNGLAPSSQSLKNIKRKTRAYIRGWVKTVLNTALSRNADLKDSTLDPEMQMNPYHLNELLFIIQSSGIKNMHTEFTDHGGELGVFLYFQKPAHEETKATIPKVESP